MKKQLREQFKNLNFSLEKATLIQEKSILFLKNFFEKTGKKIVGTYAPMPNEVPCDIMEAFLKEQGQNIYHPRWAEKGKPFIEYEIVPDILFIPGLAFSPSGYRLGRGGGSFDRYLAEHPGIFKIGLAFSEQIVNDIGAEDHDIPMDIVITELS